MGLTEEPELSPDWTPLPDRSATEWVGTITSIMESLGDSLVILGGSQGGSRGADSWSDTDLFVECEASSLKLAREFLSRASGAIGLVASGIDYRTDFGHRVRLLRAGDLCSVFFSERDSFRNVAHTRGGTVVQGSAEAMRDLELRRNETPQQDETVRAEEFARLLTSLPSIAKYYARGDDFAVLRRVLDVIALLIRVLDQQPSRYLSGDDRDLLSAATRVGVVLPNASGSRKSVDPWLVSLNELLELRGGSLVASLVPAAQRASYSSALHAYLVSSCGSVRGRS